MSVGTPPAASRWQRAADVLMGGCLAAMATVVFVNVVLRYGFGSGIAASEELSRLLFVWMVFIGATAAYPRGEHMAFTSLLGLLRCRPRLFAAMVVLVRLLVLAVCVMLAWGAWQQVVVGMDSRSVVLGYPTALLPLPALLCALALGAMVVWELATRRPMSLGYAAQTD